MLRNVLNSIVWPIKHRWFLADVVTAVMGLKQWKFNIFNSIQIGVIIVSFKLTTCSLARARRVHLSIITSSNVRTCERELSPMQLSY